MSDFVSAFDAVDQSLLDRMKEKAGSVELPTRDQIEQNTINNALRSIQQRKIRACYKLSIWSGDEEIKFNFADWDVSKQENVEKAKQVGNQAYKLAKQLMADSFNVTLYGNSGVGKTSLAIAMMTMLRDEANKSIMVVSTAELASLLDNFGTEGGAINALKPVRKDMQDYLYRVANSRISGDKTTIITTNNSDDQLKNMYNAKTISRLLTKNKDHMIFFKNMKDVREV